MLKVAEGWYKMCHNENSRLCSDYGCCCCRATKIHCRRNQSGANRSGGFLRFYLLLSLFCLFYYFFSFTFPHKIVQHYDVPGAVHPVRWRTYFCVCCACRIRYNGMSTTPAAFPCSTTYLRVVLSWSQSL